MSEDKQEELFWQGLSGEEKRYLRKSGSYIPFSPEEIIFRKGETSDGMYMIVSGEVDIMDHDETGDDIHIRTLSSGMILGEIGAFATSNRTATVRGRTTGILFKINKPVLDSLIENCPHCMSHIFLNTMHLMSQRIIQLTTEVSNLKKRIK